MLSLPKYCLFFNTILYILVWYLGRNEFVLIKSLSLFTKKDNILYGLKGFSKMPTSGFYEKNWQEEIDNQAPEKIVLYK